ncbi:MAG TPA: site-2 protease family protein [Acidimicrobiales bacterium]
MSSLAISITLVAALIPSVILHEIAHGLTAYRFGDPTARNAGRLTLNPLRHLDPFGSIILPAILAFSSFGIFGYAKPVPVNPRLMRHPRNHSLLVSLAGPAANIVIAVMAAGVTRLLTPESTPWFVAVYVGFVNSILAAFNLLPIPPLDGSAIVERLLPRPWWPAWLRLRRYSMGLLLIFLLAVPGVLSPVFEGAIGLWFELL